MQEISSWSLDIPFRSISIPAGPFNSVAMASRLPLPVVVMVMTSLLLQSASASALVAVEPRIEMVVDDSSSSSNDICHYELTVRTSGPVLGSGTDSTITFEFWDNHGQSVWVSQSGAGYWFEQNGHDVITFDSDRCIKPCQAIITTDGTGPYADWKMSYVTVVVTGGSVGSYEITFFNGTPGSDGMGGKWIGPGYDNYLSIDECVIQHAAAPILQRINN